MKPKVSSSKRYAKSAPVTRRSFDDLGTDNDSVPMFLRELRSRTSERSPSTTPPQKGKNPGPGERRLPSFRLMKPSRKKKIAMASQNKLLARSFDIKFDRLSARSRQFFSRRRAYRGEAATKCRKARFTAEAQRMHGSTSSPRAGFS